MAEAQLDKSLDALIEEKRGKQGSGGRGKGIRVKPSTTAPDKARGGMSGQQRMQRQQKGPKQNGNRAPIPALAVQGKKIAKQAGGKRFAPPMVPWMMPPPFPMGHGGRMGHGMPPPYMMMQPPYQGEQQRFSRPQKEFRKKDPDATARWGHDMFDPSDMGPPKRNLAARTGGAAAAAGATLRITNLHHDVSDGDIKELFSTAGELLSSRIDYDASGRSLGTATVVFKVREDAVRAKRDYNNVALDGMQLSIELQEGRELTTLSSGIRVTKVKGGDEYSAAPAASSGQRLQGAGRMFQSAIARPSLPRGMGDPAPGPARRGQGPGPRSTKLRSRATAMSVAAEDDMLE